MGSFANDTQMLASMSSCFSWVKFKHFRSIDAEHKKGKCANEDVCGYIYSKP